MYHNYIKSWNNFIREKNKQSSNFKTIDLKTFSEGRLKRILKQYGMDSYKESMPVQWFRTKWFVSQTLETMDYQDFPEQVQYIQMYKTA